MRGTQNFQAAMFSDISLEERVPAKHPLRKLRMVVDALLTSMTAEFDALDARRGRPSVPPEMLLKARLLQILFSIRSERLLVEAIDDNLLYRWFVGLNLEDKVWDHSTFSANRERLFHEELARVFFERVKHTAGWAKLTSDERVDGTLIEAWASHKSFKRKARRLIVGADKGYDCKAFVLKAVASWVIPPARGGQGAALGQGRTHTRRHEDDKTSLRVRKRIEEALGWIKTVGGLAKTKLIGQAKLAGQALMCLATYNLVRMGSIGGWWDAHHA